jgi:GR25 family glycosyltransferase involved in LPS biosynthesis
MPSPSSLSTSSSSLSPLSVSSSPSISSDGDYFYSSSSFSGRRVSSSPRRREQQQRRREERTGQGITTWIRTMFVLLTLITVWYNTRNSIYITSTLSFIAFDRQQHQIQQIQQQQQQQQGCAGDNSKTTTTAFSTKEMEKKSSQLQKLQKQRQKRPRHRLGLLTSQTYVISFHSKKVTETFRNRNLYTGFYGTNYTFLEEENEDNENNAVDNDNDNDVIWFQSVNGYDPIVLKEWNDITTRRTDTNKSNFPIITPEMGRNGFVYPYIKTEPYYEQGLENNTNSYLSPHVIGCYESHRQLLTFISKTWNWNNENDGNNKQQGDDDDDDDEPVDNDGDKDENKDEEKDNEVEDEDNNLQQQQTQTLSRLPPDAIFIFEDDAVCVDDTKQYILNELIPTLPTTWDIIYIGGKPFSYLDNNRSNYDGETENEDNSFVGSIFKTKEERDHFLQEKELCDYSSGGDRRFGDRSGGALCPIFRQYACEGKFGTSSTGPFGATTATATAKSNTTSDSDSASSRNTFHPNQPYWKTNYILDTHAYVINPKHIQKVVQILNDMVRISNPIDNFRPIDITLADNMNSDSMNSIQAYLPSKGEYCKQVPHDYDYDQKQQEQRQNEQEQKNQDQKLGTYGNADTNSERSNFASKRIKSKPIPHEGYYHHNSFGVIWEELYFHECPDSYSNGLL